MRNRLDDLEYIDSGHGYSWPVLDAEIASCGCCLRVWCLHCKTYHFHGMGGSGSTGEGHRASHCYTDSLWKGSGYILRIKERSSTERGKGGSRQVLARAWNSPKISAVIRYFSTEPGSSSTRSWPRREASIACSTSAK
jgi:hypothetical protein